ncbi:MAG: hypothetical protein RLZZ244_3071 [Verrucomicrobiota bacterium]|jgi:DNA-directed RNA polymerase specialized sigma24 family protein
MVRNALIGVLASWATLIAWGETSPTPPPGPFQPTSQGSKNQPPQVKTNTDSESLGSVKKMLETLTPEQKQRLEDNMKAWKQLTPEQRQSLREKDGLVRKKFLEEAIEASASLPEERREAFQKQYVEERRKLEASLRHDLEARRKHGIEEILRKLNVPSPPPPPASADPSLPASR